MTLPFSYRISFEAGGVGSTAELCWIVIPPLPESVAV